MDFFEAQDRARGLSKRLLLLYALAVTAMIATVYLVALFTFGVTVGVEEVRLFRPGLLLGVSLVMGLLIGSGTVFRTAQLRRGGPAVAELLGGRRVDPGTSDARERQLLNVVEEMAIASGMPVPAVFVLDREDGINAFAAGHTIHDAAVAVTRGSLESLTRDELQGVIAHEFSHILNGDMRLNVRLMGLLFGILLLTVVGRGLARSGGMRGGGGRGGRGGGGAQVALLGLALIVVGYLGVFFGRLIQAAVSRQREFLADAAAVQFTRNPAGLAGALRKIGAAARGSRVRDHHAQEVGHLFFAEGLRAGFLGMLATHPPLEERIRRVDPRWDGRGEGAEDAALAPARDERAPEPRRAPGTDAGTFPFPLPFPSPPAPGAEKPSVAPAGHLAAAAVATVGAPRPGHLSYARRLLERVPEAVRRSAADPDGAVALVVALLLSEEEAVRSRQLAEAADRLGDRAAADATALRDPVSAAGAAARLPLLDLALPSLRALPPQRAAALRTAVGALARADGRLRTFEFALFHILQANLSDPAGRAPGDRRREIGSLDRVRREAEVVLSALARAGARSEEDARAAFHAGTARLPSRGAASWTLQPAGVLDLAGVDAALGQLEETAPAVRKALIEAAAAVVLADERAEPEETELLRAVAEALEAPMPPLLAG